MSTLVTLDEFRASPFNDAKWTDDAVGSALGYAEQRFYILTGRLRIGMWFVARAEEHILNGTDHELIRVPHPVLEIESVTLVDDDNVDTEVTDEVRIKPGSRYLWRALKFPRGYANVVVSGEFGDPLYAVAG